MGQVPETNSARSAIILAVVVSVVALFIVFFGTQTLTWLDARRMLSQNPWLAETPQSRPAAPAVAAPAPPPASKSSSKPASKAAVPKSTQLRVYNFEFNVPWTSKWQQTASLIATEFRFDSGQVIVFFDPEDQADIVHNIREDTTRSFTALQPLLADGGINTNYDLYQAIYAASPAQISLSTAANDAQRLRTLLLTKLSFGFDLEKKVSSFDFGTNKGVQFGDPAKGEPVALRVFNDRDKQFRFIFTARDGSHATIAQDDIDAALQSLQPIPLLER